MPIEFTAESLARKALLASDKVMSQSSDQMPPSEESIYLSRFESPSEIRFPDVQRSFEAARKLPLRQAWQTRPERDFQPGSVVAAWCPRNLHILAHLTDQDIVLAGGSSHTSTLAVFDVFQVYIDRPEENDYLEIHVTPDNQARAIRWTPDLFAQFRNGEISIDEILLNDGSGLFSKTWVEEDDASWQVYLQIPIHFLSTSQKELEKDKSIRGTFCRFDASPDSLTPILSSTSAFQTGPKFHESSDWHEFILQV
tara:strand:- start:12052 stop:12813 length:762 start_codon:yes stop_codon:yes gene_type:complete